MLLEDITHQSASFANAQPAIAVSGDSGGVLTPVLQDRQTIIDALIDRTRTDDADNSAHCSTAFGHQTLNADRLACACRVRSSPITARNPFAMDSPYGMRTDWRHQRSPSRRSTCARITKTPNSTKPRKTPKTKPKKQTNPQKKKRQTKKATVTPIPAPSNSSSATMMTRAAQVDIGEGESNPPRCGASKSEKCHATNSAMIHVTSAIASRRKPRNAPTTAEMTMVATTR